MANKFQSKILNYIFVSLQFGGILVLLLSGPIFPTNLVLLIIECLGIALAFWSIFTMQLNNLSIFPTLKEDAIFISSGPYRLIRHPMYLSILITFIPLIIGYFSVFRLLILFVIAVDLLFKLQYEEKILTQDFPNYKLYTKNTYKLIPYLY